MGNYIADNRDELSTKHYIRKAGAENYWFDFYYGRVEEYKKQFGDNFCMVIYGSENIDDAYVMPYKQVADLFSIDSLDDRERWIGNVRNDVIRLPGARSMSVSAYYNAFELLDSSDVPTSQRMLLEEPVFYDVGDSIDRTTLIERIREFNSRYQEVAPYRRRVVSEQIARPGAITDYLKGLLDFTCQICNEQGFLQANGTRYVETHHITELHKLIPGSYCSDNLVVVCANCHRKLHRARVAYQFSNSGNVIVAINGVEYQFTRTTLSS